MTLYVFFFLRLPRTPSSTLTDTLFHYTTLCRSKVPAAEPALLRCYSLSQRPQAYGALRITIKRVPGGRASNWLLDNLQAGYCIEALPPAGDRKSTRLNSSH